MGTPEAPVGKRTRGDVANLFVIVALFAMLVGTVVVLGARDTGFTDVPPGEQVTAFSYDAPTWDPLGHPMQAKLLGPGSYNITAVETTGTGKGEGPESGTLSIGQSLIWNEKAAPGESWLLTVRSDGNTTLRVSWTVSSDLGYTGGGIFVGIGILGFVFYRRGMA